MKARAVENLRLFLPTKWKGLHGSKELAAAIDALLKDAKTTATGLQLIAAAGATDRVDRGRGDHRATTTPRLDTPQGSDPHARQAAGPRSRSRHWSRSSASRRTSLLEQSAIQSLGGLLAERSAKDDGRPRRHSTRSGRSSRAPSVDAELQVGGGRCPGRHRDRHRSGSSTRTRRATCRRKLVAEAGRLLRNCPFQGERNRALLLFPAPGKLNPKNLPAIAELAKRTGDAAQRQGGVEREPRRARRSARSATWSAASAGRSARTCHDRQEGQQARTCSSRSCSRRRPSPTSTSSTRSTTTAEVTVTGLLVADTPDAHHAPRRQRQGHHHPQEGDRGRGAEAQDLDHARGRGRGADRGRTDRPGRVPGDAQDARR